MEIYKGKKTLLRARSDRAFFGYFSIYEFKNECTCACNILWFYLLCVDGNAQNGCVFFVKRYAVREAKKWSYTVRKAKIVSTSKGGGGCHPPNLYRKVSAWSLTMLARHRPILSYTDTGQRPYDMLPRKRKILKIIWCRGDYQIGGSCANGWNHAMSVYLWL